MNSRQPQNDPKFRRKLAVLRACVAGAGLGLGSVARLYAQDAATMQLPQPAQPDNTFFTQPAVVDQPPDLPPPPTYTQSPDFKFPPPYSSTKNDSSWPLLSGVWRWFAGSDDKKTAPPKDEKKGPASSKDKKTAYTPPKDVPPQPVPPGVRPAWGWYGYGAPVPGHNPLAPEGAYAPVHPDWFQQMCTTPGAIPATLPAQNPVLPAPAPIRPSTMPPVLPLPAPASNSGLILPPDEPARPPVPMENGLFGPKRRPAEIQIPNPTVEPPLEIPEPPARIEVPTGSGTDSDSNRTFTPILPVSAREMKPVSRAQSPDSPQLPPGLLKSLRSECTGYATKIELIQKGPSKITLRLMLMRANQADHLANRIAKIPELQGYEVEMEFPQKP